MLLLQFAMIVIADAISRAVPITVILAHCQVLVVSDACNVPNAVHDEGCSQRNFPVYFRMIAMLAEILMIAASDDFNVAVGVSDYCSCWRNLLFPTMAMFEQSPTSAVSTDCNVAAPPVTVA